MDDLSAAGNKEAAETRAAEKPVGNARESLVNEVVNAIKGLLITMSRPFQEDVVVNLEKEVCGIAKAMAQICLTEQHEVLGVFRQAVEAATKDGVNVKGELDPVRILEVIFCPALTLIRDHEDIEQMFADLVPPTVRSTGEEA